MGTKIVTGIVNPNASLQFQSHPFTLVRTPGGSAQGDYTVTFPASTWVGDGATRVAWPSVTPIGTGRFLAGALTKTNPNGSGNMRFQFSNASGQPTDTLFAFYGIITW